jgi:hypothetical protein
MYQFFLICATIGGTILLLRLALSLVGFGLETIDAEFGDIGATHADTVDHAGGHDGHSHEWRLGKVFTFQAIVSFLAFFGIGGLSALGARQAPAVAILIGMVAGFVAVSLLGYALGSLRHLNADGTVRLERAVGLGGTVYLRVAGSDSGEGKVMLPIQGRLLEVAARTPGPELRAGEPVIVCRILNDHTVEVVAAHAYVTKPPALVD